MLYTLVLEKFDSNAAGEVPIKMVAAALSPKTLARLLEDYVNNFQSGFNRGLETGKQLTRAHRTLQRSVIDELVGIISGLALQERTDLRNKQAIELAKKIKELYEQEGTGPMI